MGPILLFDKSFLQSLSVDESVWLDNFYITNICPLFYVETLSDLEKTVRDGRTPEQEVRIIAAKTPEMHVSANMFHHELCLGDLLGQTITMDGRPVIPGGKPVKSKNKKGFVFEPSPEAEAFSRWQKEEFHKIERKYAKNWRKTIEGLDFKEVSHWLNSVGIKENNCKTLEEAKDYALTIVNGRNNPLNRMKFVFSILSMPPEYFMSVYNRWGALGCPSLSVFAPYAAHLLTIELFFYISISSNLISAERKTNKTDLAYLYYLPFCMVFVSSDRLHKKCAPLFMREDQEFVWGIDLKADLKKIDQYFDAFPESEKEKGLHAIATHPPVEGEYLTSALWDRFLPKWRSIFVNRESSIPSSANERIFNEIKEFTDGQAMRPEEVDFDGDSADALVLKRSVHKKKGKWWQIAKAIEDNKNKG
jgi:hypothetical protein